MALHFAGGTDLASGEMNLKFEQNTEARNMEYEKDGKCLTSEGYGDVGWDWGNANEGIDGLFASSNYPNLIFAAVNGKIRYVDASVSPQATGTTYEADTGLSLTKDNRVLMKEYRGTLYFCNGVENVGRISLGQLGSAMPTADDTLTIADGDVAYGWTLSGSGTNEYYVRTHAGANPVFYTPDSVIINGSAATQGTVGSLAAGRWGYGNTDTLGYSTIYVRLSDGTDPDTKASGYVQMTVPQLVLANAAEGNRFTNGVDKVYIAGDEIDYNKRVNEHLYWYSNASSHAAGAYVTQYNTLTAPPSGSLKAKCMAFFREFMFIAGMSDIPNVVYVGGTTTNQAVHDFSDGENYIIGEGGAITALLPTRDRLYIFLKDKIYYIGIVVDSAGLEILGNDKLFSGNHGTPNAFCVAEMGDVTVVFTGSRVIRIGYDPATNQLLPDEQFDSDILPVLANCDTDQSNAEVHYNQDRKELRVKFSVDGIYQTAIYNNLTKKWAYPSDADASCYTKFQKITYFGSTTDDVVYKMGLTFDADDIAMIHRYVTGRQDDKSRNPKLFLRGKIEGVKRPGNKIYLTTYIDNQAFGGPREINDTHIRLTSPGNPVGESVIGEDAIGDASDSSEGSGQLEFSYPFLIGRRGKDIRLVFTSYEIGSDWGLAKAEVEYDENIIDPAKYY